MDTEAKLAAGRDFAKNLNAVVKAVRLYGAEHSRVTSQLDLAWATLRGVLSDSSAFVLGASPPNLFLDGASLGASPIEAGFAEFLKKGGIHTIRFASHATHESFTSFVCAVATAGNKPGLALERATEALADPTASGIQVSGMQEDSGGGPPGMSVQFPLGALRDPQALLIALASLAGDAPAAADLPPVQTAEVVSLLRLVTLLRQTEADPGRAEEIGPQLSKLPPAAVGTLMQSLTDLGENPRPGLRELAVLTQLGMDLILSHALDGFTRGEIKTADVRPVFDRLGNEVRVLPGISETGGQPRLGEEILLDFLAQRFWEAAPSDKKREALLSADAWCVPPAAVKTVVHEMLEAGDNLPAYNVLMNYASCVANPEAEIRRASVEGLRALANLYASSVTEALEGALEHLAGQLQKEEVPELKELLTNAFLQVHTAAIAIIKPTPASTLVRCMTCKEVEAALTAVGPWANTAATHQLTLYCRQCGDLTLWSTPEPGRPDKRTAPAAGGEEQRQNRRVHMDLPIRVRSETPGQEFTVEGKTVNISRSGVLFSGKKLIVVGLEVLVLMPYDPDEELPESKAKVIRCDQQEEGVYYTALHFER